MLIFSTFLVANSANSANTANMKTAKKMREPEPKPETGRLFTTLPDEEWRRQYSELREAAGTLGDSELLRQALVRLFDEVRATKQLVIKTLTRAA